MSACLTWWWIAAASDPSVWHIPKPVAVCHSVPLVISPRSNLGSLIVDVSHWIPSTAASNFVGNTSSLTLVYPWIISRAISQTLTLCSLLFITCALSTVLSGFICKETGPCRSWGSLGQGFPLPSALADILPVVPGCCVYSRMVYNIPGLHSQMPKVCSTLYVLWKLAMPPDNSKVPNWETLCSKNASSMGTWVCPSHDRSSLRAYRSSRHIAGT